MSFHNLAHVHFTPKFFGLHECPVLWDANFEGGEFDPFTSYGKGGGEETERNGREGEDLVIMINTVNILSCA